MQLVQLATDFFDELPTAPIPPETMREVIYGEGHAPAGPSRPTRDIRTPVETQAIDGQFDLSDGVPIQIDDAPTERR